MVSEKSIFPVFPTQLYVKQAAPPPPSRVQFDPREIILIPCAEDSYMYAMLHTKLGLGFIDSEEKMLHFTHIELLGHAQF